MTKILFWLLQNKNKLVLYSIGLIFVVTMLNMTYNSLSSQLLSPSEILNLTPPIKPKPKKHDTNFKRLKREAMDSLVDHQILTPENIHKIDSIYPDSLCGC